MSIDDSKFQINSLNTMGYNYKETMKLIPGIIKIQTLL